MADVFGVRQGVSSVPPRRSGRGALPLAESRPTPGRSGSRSILRTPGRHRNSRGAPLCAMSRRVFRRSQSFHASSAGKDPARARAFRHSCPAEGVARCRSMPQFKLSESQPHEIATFLTWRRSRGCSARDPQQGWRSAPGSHRPCRWHRSTGRRNRCRRSFELRRTRRR